MSRNLWRAGAVAIALLSVSATADAASFFLPGGTQAAPSVVPMLPTGQDNQVAPISAQNPLPLSRLLVSVRAAPLVQTASYAPGSSVGGVIAFPSAARIEGGTGEIRSVSVSFAGGAQPMLDIVLFDANPTASTITDNAAVAISSADLGKVVGVVPVSVCCLLGVATRNDERSDAQSRPVSGAH